MKENGPPLPLLQSAHGQAGGQAGGMHSTDPSRRVMPSSVVSGLRSGSQSLHCGSVSWSPYLACTRLPRSSLSLFSRKEFAS